MLSLIDARSIKQASIQQVYSDVPRFHFAHRTRLEQMGCHRSDSTKAKRHSRARIRTSKNISLPLCLRKTILHTKRKRPPYLKDAERRMTFSDKINQDTTYKRIITSASKTSSRTKEYPDKVARGFVVYKDLDEERVGPIRAAWLMHASGTIN